MKEETQDIFDHLKVREIETPDVSYFEKLAATISEEQQPKVIPMYKKPMVWMVAAAAVIAVFFLVDLGEIDQEQDVLLALYELPKEEVYSYVEGHIDDFETEMIADVIPTEDIEVVKVMEPASSPEIIEPITETELNFDDIEAEDILEYLDSEEIDLYELNESELF